MEEYIGKFKKVLENIGVYLEEFDESLSLEEIIYDSLTYVSFFLEIEDMFGIEIPDEYYTVNVNKNSVSEFLTNVVVPLQHA